jgi:organic radical activating enzyme
MVGNGKEPDNMEINHIKETKQFTRLFGFRITERCNLRCKHCLLAAQKSGRDLALSDLRRWLIDLAATKRIDEVGFSGGEPFMVLDTLREGIALATSLGFKTTVATSGYWASSTNRAIEILKSLPSLNLLGLSFDRFHQEFIAPDTIRKAVLAAQEVGINVAIRVTYLDDEKSELTKLERMFGATLNSIRVDTEPILRVGRAANEISSDLFCNRIRDEPCMAASVHSLAPDGTVYACCGAAPNLLQHNPLRLGNAKEQSLKSILDQADDSLILQIIRTYGPYYLWHLMLGQSDENIQSLMTDRCTLCLSLMSNPYFESDFVNYVQGSNLLRKVAVMRLLLYQEPVMLASMPERCGE